MKTCRTCNTEKPLSEFHKCKVYKDGYNSECAACNNAYKRKIYENPETRAKKHAYNVKNKEIQAIKSKQYRDLHKDELYEKRRQNVEHKKKLDYDYGQRFPEKIAAKAAKRRAQRLQATPSWASQKYIACFYQMAKDEEIRTGRKVHVDHIVPLKSKLVCGLHCEDNLQLLFDTDNMHKFNSWWPDMPDPEPNSEPLRDSP